MSSTILKRPSNILEEIETSFAVDTIRCDGIQLWPLLRIHYYFASQRQHDHVFKKKAPKKKIWDVMLNSLLGLSVWFKKRKYVVVADDILRKQRTDGMMLDKSFDALMRLFPNEFLYVEKPRGRHVPSSLVPTVNRVSYQFLENIVKFVKFFQPKRKIENELILRDIEARYQLVVSYQRHIDYFFAKKSVFHVFFKWMRPKIFFTSCYYIKMAEIFAAKNLSIPVVEMQHGMMGLTHPGYHIYRDFEKMMFPDVVWTFGDYDSQIQTHVPLPIYRRADAVGNDYLQDVASQRPDNGYQKHLEAYEKVIVVSCQDTTDDVLGQIIARMARERPHFLFILSLRLRSKSDYEKFGFGENVKLENGKTIYELFLYADLHMTVYSTCAMEALSFGVPNVLYDFKGLATYCFADALIDGCTTYVTADFDELCQLVDKVDKKQLGPKCLSRSEFFFKRFNAEMVKQAIQEIEIR